MRPATRAVVAALVVCVTVACSGDDGAVTSSTANPPLVLTSTSATGAPSPTAVTVTSTPPMPATTLPVVATEPITAPPPTPAAVPTVPAAPGSGSDPVAGGDTGRGYPFGDDVNSSYGTEHHDYPAADIFARCGAPVISAVDGTVTIVNAVNVYDRSVDDPATRGGIYVAVVGDDGVRYYMAHFQALAPGLAVGQRISRGDPIGEVGQTGRASGCHLHFSISPACTTTEWWVRRGAIWPQQYLDSWRDGGNLSPVDEVNRFVAEHPGLCDDPTVMPWPSD